MACVFCGDSIEEEMCMSCEETASDLGVDIEELNDIMSIGL